MANKLSEIIAKCLTEIQAGATAGTILPKPALIAEKGTFGKVTAINFPAVIIDSEDEIFDPANPQNVVANIKIVTYVTDARPEVIPVQARRLTHMVIKAVEDLQPQLFGGDRVMFLQKGKYFTIYNMPQLKIPVGGAVLEYKALYHLKPEDI